MNAGDVADERAAVGLRDVDVLAGLAVDELDEPALDHVERRVAHGVLVEHLAGLERAPLAARRSQASFASERRGKSTSSARSGKRSLRITGSLPRRQVSEDLRPAAQRRSLPARPGIPHHGGLSADVRRPPPVPRQHGCVQLQADAQAWSACVSVCLLEARRVSFDLYRLCRLGASIPLTGRRGRPRRATKQAPSLARPAPGAALDGCAGPRAHDTTRRYGWQRAHLVRRADRRPGRSHLAAARAEFGATTTATFLDWLPLARASHEFWDPARSPADWSVRRPFFVVPKGKGSLDGFNGVAARRASTEARCRVRPLTASPRSPSDCPGRSLRRLRPCGRNSPTRATTSRAWSSWPFARALDVREQGGLVIAENYPRVAYGISTERRAAPAKPRGLSKPQHPREPQR